MARLALQQKKKALFLKALERNLGNITAACRATNIPRRTIYNWLKADEEFKRAVEEMDEMKLDFAEGKLFQLINEGNAAATIYYLKTHGQSRGYVERMEVDTRNISAVKVEIIPLKSDANQIKPNDADD